MGHLGDVPARPLPPTINVFESTAPPPPPRLDEPSVALVTPPPPPAFVTPPPPPASVTPPPPPASSCPEPNSKAKRSARPEGLGASLMARSRERAKELDEMSREEIVELYRRSKKNNNKLPYPDLHRKKRCGLKRRDTGRACNQVLTRLVVGFGDPPPSKNRQNSFVLNFHV